jgi:hypothetical protein
MKSISLLFRLAFVLALPIMPSQASVIFTAGGGGTGNNVLLHCPPGDLACVAENADNDSLLFGTVQNTLLQTQFDANVNIMPGASGQATIVPVLADDAWTLLDLSWINFASTDEVILRVKPLEDDTTVVLSATDQFGNTFTSAPNFAGVPAPQGQFFTLTTADGQLITSVRIASDKSLAEIEQVRLGNLFNAREGGGETPEPGTLFLFGAGLVVAGVMRRRRQIRQNL